MNLEYILPFDIIKIIYSYLSLHQKRLTNKNNWTLFYKCKINDNLNYSFFNNFNVKNTYIRFLILNKLSFIFDNYIKLINTKSIRHWKTSRYNYNKKKYKNYIDFLKWYSRRNNSNKCLHILLAFEKDIKSKR